MDKDRAIQKSYFLRYTLDSQKMMQDCQRVRLKRSTKYSNTLRLTVDDYKVHSVVKLIVVSITIREELGHSVQTLLAAEVQYPEPALPRIK